MSLWKAFGVAVCTAALLHFPQAPLHSKHRNPQHFCGDLEAASGSETCLPRVHHHHHYPTNLAVSSVLVCSVVASFSLAFISHSYLFPYHQAQIWGWGEVVMVAISSLLNPSIAALLPNQQQSLFSKVARKAHKYFPFMHVWPFVSSKI